MASQGPNSPSTMANIDLGLNDWTTPSNATASDDTYVTFTISTLDEVTDGLRATNFGFAIPTTATIDGIVVEIERYCDTATAVWDYSVAIVKGGATTGTDQSAGAYWSTTEGYVTFGGASNPWGTTWTPADINATDFGVQFQLQDAGVGGGQVARVDHIRITVHYTDGGVSRLMLLGVGP